MFVEDSNLVSVNNVDGRVSLIQMCSGIII